MEKEYLSIKDFAACAGITKQAVYKQLNNRLKNYCELVDGQKKLKIIALKEVYGIEVDDLLFNKFGKKTTSSTTDSISKIAFDALLKQVETLREELGRKDEQIRMLQKTVSESHTALMKSQENLEREQQLHLISQQKILRLETAANEETATTEEPAVKESFWRRLFGK